MVVVGAMVYGRALFLDRCVQSLEGDEEFYHEPVVHVTCVAHGSPKSVLIIGDCEGAMVQCWERL